MDSWILVLILEIVGSQKRSKAEVKALRETNGVSNYVEMPGAALFPQEGDPEIGADQLFSFYKRNLSYNPTMIVSSKSLTQY